MSSEREHLRTLTLPYENVRTVYEGDSEVRLYRNTVTGTLQVGKRFDTLGLEDAVAVQEGALLRDIHHDHIVKIYDVAMPSGYAPPETVVEIVMPFYERGSLFDNFMFGASYSVDESLRLTLDVLLGLRELHEVHHILHRDVKAPNVLLDDLGRGVVSDLGLATEMASDGSAESLRDVRLYSPPETLSVGRVDARSEVFQVGLILHELLNGPFPYGDPALTIANIAVRLDAGKSALLPRHLVPAAHIPRPVRRILNRALARNPTDRFPSAASMSHAITAANYIDWRVIEESSTFTRWEGTTPSRPGELFAVEAKLLVARRAGAANGWKFSATRRITSPRRILEDQLFADANSPAVRSFFDQIATIALS